MDDYKKEQVSIKLVVNLFTMFNMKILYSLLLLFVPILAVSQSQLSIDSTRFIVGERCCTQIRFTIPTWDKGILFVGMESSDPGGIIPPFSLDPGVNGNVLVGKLDSQKNISWIKVYGGSREEVAIGACQTVDSGFAVLAETFSSDGNISSSHGGNDLWLLRLDHSGNLLWEKNYGSSGSDVASSISNTPDHGFILLGATNGSDGDVPFHYGGPFSLDWLVIKTDSMGTTQWSKDIGGTGFENENGSILSIDNSYYIASSSNSNDHDCTDTIWHSGFYKAGDSYFLLKLDNAGNVLWDSSYGGGNEEQVFDVMFDARDSTIMITGTTSSSDYMVTGYHGGDNDIWVTKINKKGTLIWQKTLGGKQDDHGTGICARYKGGYIVYGWKLPGTIGPGGDCLLFALNPSGDEILNKTFGGTDYDRSFSIINYSGGYAAAGLSDSYIFTEGTTYGNDAIGGAFISFIDTGGISDTGIVNTLTKQLTSTNAGLIAYPNPANAEIKIISGMPGNLIILNSFGKIILQEQSKGICPIEIKNWTSGLYIAVWQGSDGITRTAKFLKK
jgi:hypothetical protein